MAKKSDDNAKRRSSTRKSNDSATQQNQRRSSNTGNSSSHERKTDKTNNNNGGKKKSNSLTTCKDAKDGNNKVTITNEMKQEFDMLRTRLREIDVACRDEIDRETKAMELAENEIAAKFREENFVELAKKIRELQEEFCAKIEKVSADIVNEKTEEIKKLQTAKADANDEKRAARRAEIEAEIRQRRESAKADVERFRARREAERDEDVEKAKERCAKDIAEFAEKLSDMIAMLEDESAKQDSQTQMDRKKSRKNLGFRIREWLGTGSPAKDENAIAQHLNEMRAQIMKAQGSEITRLNRELAGAMVNLRTAREQTLAQNLAERRKELGEKLAEIQAKIQEKFAEERERLRLRLTVMEDRLQNVFEFEQIEIARRLRTKQELLDMLSMPDAYRLTDEEFIISRYGYTIERHQSVHQSNASLIYRAKTKDGKDCLCKITVFQRWSVRHRTDFLKHSSRLLRNLAARGGDKAPPPVFPRVIEILITDTKLYTFMLPFGKGPTISLDAYLAQLARRITGKSPAHSKDRISSQLRKKDMQNILRQLVSGVRFLANLFIAHANIIIENVTLVSANDKDIDLSNCRIVLTGLTRPIVYFNVESDELITAKGFEPGNDDDPIEHLPPECFNAEFQPLHLDEYSVGVLAYRLIRIRSPYADLGGSVSRIVATKRAEPVRVAPLTENEAAEHGPELVQLIATLTHPVPEQRMPPDAIPKSKYLQ